MSLRDEMEQMMQDTNEWMRPDERDALADALMPLVERAVREAIEEGWRTADDRGPYRESFDAIVARVTGKGICEQKRL